jgi:hypothetical protein
MIRQHNGKQAPELLTPGTAISHISHNGAAQAAGKGRNTPVHGSSTREQIAGMNTGGRSSPTIDSGGQIANRSNPLVTPPRVVIPKECVQAPVNPGCRHRGGDPVHGSLGSGTPDRTNKSGADVLARGLPSHPDFRGKHFAECGD